MLLHLSSSLMIITDHRTNNLPLPNVTFLQEHLKDALLYLVKISEVEEVEVFKICLEYWSMLASDLYRENPFSATPLLLGSRSSETPVHESIARYSLA